MISKISNWLKSKRLIRSFDGHGVIPTAFSPVNQEDIRDITAVKNFNKSFDAQQQQMQARSMVAHEPDCDVISCRKKSCFIWSPDKIVRKSTVKMKRIKYKGD